jgi:hypothetical protein
VSYRPGARTPESTPRRAQRRPPSRHKEGLLLARLVYRTYLRRGFNRKVDVILAGAMRAGTTALFSYIREHPEVCPPIRKEVHFFDRERNFRGQPDYRRYHACFDPQPQHKVLFEATPQYMYGPRYPARLRDYNPGLRLIVILRSPIDRAYSHWNKNRVEGFETRSFSEVVESYLAQHDGGPATRSRNIFEMGFYATQLERIWQLFPREQTLVLRSEELRDCPLETLQRAFRFMGVSPVESAGPDRFPSLPHPGPMSESDRARLRDLYEPEVHALEKALDWDCSDWLR